MSNHILRQTNLDTINKDFILLLINALGNELRHIAGSMNCDNEEKISKAIASTH